MWRRSGTKAARAAHLLALLAAGTVMGGILAGCGGHAETTTSAGPTTTQTTSAGPTTTQTTSAGPTTTQGQSPTTVASPPVSDQVKLETSIANDREHLFRGLLTYLPLDPMPVDSTQELHVTLIALGQNPAAVEVPPGKVVGSRSLQVGGVEEAALSVLGGGADISAVGPTRGLIGKPGDVVSWTWDIKPKEPREYKLDLVVITYQATSSNPLFVVNPPIQIELKVNNTLSHQISSLRLLIISIAAIIVAVGIIWKFADEIFAPIRRRMRRDRKRPSLPQDPRPRARSTAHRPRRQAKRVRRG